MDKLKPLAAKLIEYKFSHEHVDQGPLLKLAEEILTVAYVYASEREQLIENLHDAGIAINAVGAKLYHLKSEYDVNL